ncbi:SDR family NAD(P)-dependent oxidoreductase [Paenibacillus lycopersici]|uniref:SDR family NAD(P)-dependent oxidoreductase n=1 Tax=Paenibacillus lycopersici TaxID=2704462 RepID=A0A6C0G7G0_9BACL|nr:SDR family NAD(P)-dependent oxidoreductase [Paenibacillus lycopersici]QHT63677.1 SDR family NAD(P)-dependent oxidoreductase [Paenibacillus lycopersici]
MMKVTLVTGGNTGLGYETARRLKELGHKVYISSRDENKGKIASEALGVDYVVLDVTDDASVKKAAQEIEHKEGRIDVLINNAGIPGPHAKPEDLTADMMLHVYDTNVFGIVRVTHHFLPLLKRSEAPVIVNVSSGLGSFGQVLNPDKIESKVNALAYCSSKAAVGMLTVQYAKTLPAIKINAIDPGPTNTGERFKHGIQSMQEATDAVVRMAAIDKTGPTGTFSNREGIIPW